jgi:hypothetical protein
MIDPPQRRRVVAAPARKPPAELHSVRVIFEPDQDANTSYLKHEGLEERLAEYKKGAFSFVCVRAEAEVLIEEIPQTLTSGGMPGIESDSEDEYLDEIIDGEWKALRAVLKTVGVSTEQLPLGFDRAWIEWRTE